MKLKDGYELARHLSIEVDSAIEVQKTWEVAVREGKLLPLDHSKAKGGTSCRDQMKSCKAVLVTYTTKI